MASICLELVAQPQRDRLLPQVGQLPAGDLVVVDPPGRARQTGLEGGVDLADGLPVRLQVHHRPQIQVGGPLGVRQRGDQGRRRRLGGGGGHRRTGHVDRIHPGVDRGQQGGQLAAGGVVGVQVHRQVEPLPQGADTSLVAAGGRSSPAMSLIARTCAPASTICSASRR